MFSIILFTLGILFISASLEEGRLRIIACDVGQGDGSLIVTPGGAQILIDGGPGKKILDCLSQKMPFWDRKVEMILLTHPQKDHMEGLMAVLENYEVGTIVWSGVKSQGSLYSQWQKLVREEGAKVYSPHSGDRLLLDGVNLDVLWPSEEKLKIWQAQEPGDLNDSSIVVRIDLKSEVSDFCAYFTGDIPKEILEGLISKPCQILKVSHHGSKTGTSGEVLDAIKPKVAIIQVGKNSYGHPTSEVLDLLSSRNIEVLRNDTKGIIEITINGRDLRSSSAK